MDYKSRYQGFKFFGDCKGLDENIYREPLNYAKKIKNIESIDKCPLCKSEKFIKVANFEIDSLINDWIKNHGFNPFPKVYNGKILEKRYCTNCGLYFYNYHLHDDDSLYESLDNDNRYYPTYRDEYGPCIEYILKNKPNSLLEIGSGKGNFLKIVKNIIPNLVGSEYNSEARNLCKADGFNILGEDISKINQKFDMVCHFEVLEHVFDTKTLMENSVNLLKKGGSLVIGTPNPDGILKINGIDTLNLPPHHQYDFSYKTFKYIAKKYKLKIIDYIQLDLSYRHYTKYVNVLTGKSLTEPDMVGFIETAKKYKGHSHVVIFKKK